MSLHQSMGQGRLVHAVNIACRNEYWNGYFKLHDEIFAENDLKKYRVVNAEGKMIENANDKAELIHNADGTVRHEDFLVIKDMIIEVRRHELTAIDDLMTGSGLQVDAAITDQLVGFENINEFQEAQQEMNPTSFDNNDTVFTEDFVPNPITHSSFSVPFRQQGFQYKSSLGMSESIRQVAERNQDTLINGNSTLLVSFQGSNFQIFGYTNHPDRGIDSISDWTIASNSELIVTETVTALGLMHTGQGGVKNDSVILYLANDIWTNVQNDFKAESDKTIMARLLQIAQIKEVKPVDKLADGNALLVEMLPRTIQIAVAQDIIVVPHVKTNPMSPQHMTAYSAMTHMIKSDSNSNTGVMHLSP